MGIMYDISCAVLLSAELFVTGGRVKNVEGQLNQV